MSDRTLGHPFSLGWSGPISDKPAGASAQVGGAQGIYPIRVPLVQVNASGTSNPSATIYARVFNPSKQLSCSFSVAFEATTLQKVNSYASAKWTTRALRPGGRDAREADLHTIESAQNLPRLYEMETGVRLVEIAATCTVPLDVALNPIPGNWVVSAEWEPDQPMCEADTAALYSRCSLLVTAGSTLPLAP